MLRLASLSRGAQRWLKTALQAIAALEPEVEGREGERGPEPPRGRRRGAPDLDQVLRGEVDLRQEAEAYPELSQELEGLAEIIDLLREAGERRRRLGEEILREEEEGEDQGEGENGSF